MRPFQILIPALLLGLTAAASPGPGKAVDYGKVQLPFEPNRGQADPSVRYLVRGPNYVMQIRDRETVLKFGQRSGVKGKETSVHTISLQWLGGRTGEVRGEAPTGGVSSYFLGNSPEAWKSGVPHFGKVRYSELYPGIDALYYTQEGRVEYDLVVAPGANPEAARFQVAGANYLRVQNGDLLIGTPAGEMRQHKPVVYQDFDGTRRYVSASYHVAKDRMVGFRLGRYDHSRQLIIDPVLSYSLYIGGSALVDLAEGVAVDGTGAAYITGQTLSDDFPGASGTPPANLNAFVSKMNAAGTAIVYSVYLGGSGADSAHGIAVDATGAVYVAGETNSTNFPTTSGLQTTFGGGRADGFITKLTPAGTQIAWSTYYGGGGSDAARAIAIDANNIAYVAGPTDSTNLPPTWTPKGPQDTQEIFVVSVNNAGTNFGLRTFVGGNGIDAVAGIAVSESNIILGGQTNSTDLTGAPFQPNRRGDSDALIVRLTTAGQVVSYTYLGGSVDDNIQGVAVDSIGDIYVTGATSSTDFPRASAVQTAFGGSGDAYVTKLNSTASNIIYSTYIGGNNLDYGKAIAVDAQRSAFVTGLTASPNFPVNGTIKTSLPGTPPSNNYDVFLVKVSPAGNSFLYSTLFGGSASDQALGVAVDSAGGAYVTGLTLSSDMPVTVTSSLRGGQDAFLAKISSPCAYTVTPRTITLAAAGSSQNVTITTTSNECGWLATTAGTFVTGNVAGGAGSGTVTLTAAANAGSTRTGSVNVAGVSIQVIQPGQNTCVTGVTPPALAPPASGASGTLAVNTNSPSCSWTSYSNVDWLSFFTPITTGPATGYYTIYPNFGTQPRSGVLTVDTTNVNVSQGITGLSEQQRFVALIYFYFLGRYPSQAEIDFQSGALTGGMTRANLVMNFYNSDEFNAAGRFISGLYVGILNRDAEFGGWLFQRNVLAQNLVTQDQLVTNFLGSAEFTQAHPNLDNPGFVTVLYNQILGRAPTQAEVDFQSGVLSGGGNRKDMAKQFLNSAEFRQRVGGRLTTFLLYATMLGRNPTAPELQQRQNQIASGVAVSSIVADIVAAAEFNARLQ